MGSPKSEPQRSNEAPQHRVNIAKPFAVGKFVVTFAEWDACVAGGGCGGYRGVHDEGPKGPVASVSWQDAKSYVHWVSKKTGKKYRLLSEAEREYVARAGTKTNRWGLHFGNVWEWTEDCWSENYYNVPGDGSANTSGNCMQRVVRGGSSVLGQSMEPAKRDRFVASARDSGPLGFRVARTFD